MSVLLTDGQIVDSLSITATMQHFYIALQGSELLWQRRIIAVIQNKQ
jgi:hypothetical protein